MSLDSSSFGHRRFQSTGFGLERDVKRGDALPVWKEKMFSRIRDKSKQHRHSLLQRLQEQKSKNKHLSPNSKRKDANHTIDSFKHSLIEHEMKLQFNRHQNQQSNHPFNHNQSHNHHPNHSHHMNQHHSHSHSRGMHVDMNQPPAFMQEEDMESAHLTPQQYKDIFAELARYLEETELSDLRQSWQEMEKEAEENVLEEVVAAAAPLHPQIVCCPICCKNEMEIEYLNNCQPVYSCFCGTKFQPRDKNVSMLKQVNTKQNGNPFIIHAENKENSAPSCYGGTDCHMESDEERGCRMLKALKFALSQLMECHLKQNKCGKRLNFAVVPESGYLQTW
eukprot:CAMPEP_0197021532 /NCGR_PEP_ID=MMETSP1384-20130603/2420_1 /TAXON_ID=29189 /ORGANISM="Ammonia sp." /LENGTH=334 /DNA_ID=CAMNT_0042449375 /DNA_START=101 /DNA_END=1102 /DNA_ORIENTATION=+